MISTILNYILNASAKTITFTDYGSIQQARIVLIRNLTTNQWIYKLTDTAAFGGSVSTNVLTFTASNIGMNNGDLLEIRYDAPISTDTQQVSGTFWQLTQPVSIASMPSTPVTGTFWQATQPVSIAGTVAVSGTFWQATQPISGTVTANIGTTNGLALDATLTGGTVKAILRGGAKGSTSAADVTSVSVDANTQAIHTNVTNFPATQPISGSVSVSNFPGTQAVTGTFWQSTQPISIAATVIIKADTAGNQANALKVDGSAVTQPVSGTFWQNTQPVSIAASVAVTGTFWQSTQPVSIATLPALVAGSALIGGVNLVDSAGSNKASISAAGAIKVDNSAVTQPISAVSLPLPSNAAQETGGNLATIATNQATATNQTTGNNSLAAINTLLQALNIAQGIVNSNQTGPLVQGLVDDGPSTYQVGVIQPISLTTEGRVRVSTSPANTWMELFIDIDYCSEKAMSDLIEFENFM